MTVTALAEPEKPNLPYLEWIVYKNIKGMAAEDIWKLAVHTRSSEVIQHLVELLHVAKRVLVIVVGKTPQKTAVDPFRIPMEEMVGKKKEEPIVYDSAEMLFLLPFKFPLKSTAGH